MNYILILLEVIFTFFLMFIFYKVGKKNGLYLYMVLMSSIASIIMFKTIDLFSFQVNLGIPIIMGLFICNNIIIQRFGIDEVKRIMTTSGIAYVVVGIIVSLLSLTINSDYVLTSNEVFNSLFGYDINNIRIFIGGFVSIMLMLWSSSYVYYYIRRSKNILWFSNIGTMLFIQMLESIIFVIISYIGEFDFTLLFGMIVIRYLIKIMIGMIGLIPVYTIVKISRCIMRTRKQELVSDDLKPFVCNIMKEYREKYNYSLEDLARALNYKKNRQTLHKYETGTLNIPYEIFFDIANIFNINSDVFDEIPMTKDEKDLFEKKMIRSYVNTMTGNNNITSRGEKIVNSYRNASYEPVSKMCDLSIKLMDDSMAPIYLKGDRVFFRKKDGYNSGDDIVIAVKGNVLSVRRLYKSGKAIILQAMNPKYQTIVVNVFSEDMILGKVETLSREIK